MSELLQMGWKPPGQVQEEEQEQYSQDSTLQAIGWKAPRRQQIEAEQSDIVTPDRPEPGSIPTGEPDPAATDAADFESDAPGHAERTFKAFANPVLDWMQGVNEFAADTADFFTTQPLEAAVRLAGFETDIPQVGDFVKRDQTFSGGEAGEFYEKGGEFTGAGVGILGVAKETSRRMSQSFLQQDGFFRNLTREATRVMAKDDYPAEVAASLGGALGSQIGEQVGGPVGEVAGGLAGGVAGFGSASGRAGVKATGRQAQEAAEQVRLRTDTRTRAKASKILREQADDPGRAGDVLEARKGRPITAVEKTNDRGLMTLARDIAAEDHKLGGRLDESFVRSQKSLQNEMKVLLSSTGKDGTVKPDAVSKLLQQEKASLLQGIDTRIRQAGDELRSNLGIDDGRRLSVVSRHAKTAYDGAHRDINKQLNNIWGEVAKHAQVRTQPLKDQAAAIVQRANKATELPVDELQFILGRKIRNTKNGWEITDTPVEVALKEVEDAGVLMTTRSNTSDEIRRLREGTASTPKSVPDLLDLQRGILDSLDNPVLANEDIRGAYDTARSFTRRVHEVFDEGMLGKAGMTGKTGERVLPEEFLQNLLGGSQFKQAAASRELVELARLQEQVGSARVVDNPLLSDTGAWMAGKFRREVKDGKTAQQFLEDNEELLARFPQMRAMITDAAKNVTRADDRILTGQALRESVGKNKFYKLADQSASRAVRTVLNDDYPERMARKLKGKLQKDPDAMREFRNAVAEDVLDKIMIASKRSDLIDGQISQRNLSRALHRQYDPVLRTFYSEADRARMNRVLEDIASMTEMGGIPGKPQAPYRNIFVDALTRLGMTKLSGTVFGQSIVAQNISAQAGRSAADQLTDTQVKKLLARSFTDDKVLQILLKAKHTDEDLRTLERLTPIAYSSLRATFEPEEEQQQERRSD